MSDETNLSPEFMDKIRALVETASPESLDELRDLMTKEEDEERISHLEEAFDEAAYSHFSPDNEADERDLEIAMMIYEKMAEIEEIEEELAEIKAEQDNIDLHREIHEKAVAENPDKSEAWKSHFIGDMLGDIDPELTARQEYLAAWLEAARKSIENKKYLEIPQSVIEDFMDCDCCDDDCDDDDCDCGCDCGK